MQIQIFIRLPSLASPVLTLRAEILTGKLWIKRKRLSRVSFPPFAVSWFSRKQTVGERKLPTWNILSAQGTRERARWKIEKEARRLSLAPLISNIFSRHTLQLGLNLLRFTSTSPPSEIPICSGTRGDRPGNESYQKWKKKKKETRERKEKK